MRTNSKILVAVGIILIVFLYFNPIMGTIAYFPYEPTLYVLGQKAVDGDMITLNEKPSRLYIEVVNPVDEYPWQNTMPNYGAAYPIYFVGYWDFTAKLNGKQVYTTSVYCAELSGGYCAVNASGHCYTTSILPESERKRVIVNVSAEFKDGDNLLEITWKQMPRNAGEGIYWTNTATTYEIAAETAACKVPPSETVPLNSIKMNIKTPIPHPPEPPMPIPDPTPKSPPIDPKDPIVVGVVAGIALLFAYIITRRK